MSGTNGPEYLLAPVGGGLRRYVPEDSGGGNAVLSVAGKTGDVTLVAADVGGLDEAIDDRAASLLTAGPNVTLTYDDEAGTLTISAGGGGGGATDPEVVRDVIGAALVGAGLVSIAVADEADTITISTTATANAPDEALRDRSTHTGTQPAATISDFATAVAAVSPSLSPAAIAALPVLQTTGPNAEFLVRRTETNANQLARIGMATLLADRTVKRHTALPPDGVWFVDPEAEGYHFNASNGVITFDVSALAIELASGARGPVWFLTEPGSTTWLDPGVDGSFYFPGADTGRLLEIKDGEAAMVFHPHLSKVLGVKVFYEGASGGGDAAHLDQFFGDGSDGSPTISTSVTINRDMFYDNLTLAAGGVLNTAGYRVHIRGTLDLSAAGTGAIGRSGTDGATGTGGTAALAAAHLGGTAAGTGGGAGGTAAGAAAPINTGQQVVGGGDTGAGGAGGNGAAGIGGAAGTVQARTAWTGTRRFLSDLIRGVALVGGGQVGSGGGGGGGDGGAGGAGGAAGVGGGVVWIAARTIQRGSNTNAGIIQANGGSGGNGAAAAAGNRGGGGGGAGAGGGLIYLVYAALLGSPILNALRALGGNGGNGGAGAGTGTAGAGGRGGDGGRIIAGNLATNTWTNARNGTGAAASGSTGGLGAANTLTL